MRIKRLIIRNIKCLSFVDIQPQGSVIEVHGKNAAGKSSLIDAVLMGLLGKREFGEKPIKEGEKSGEINLETDDGYKISCKMKIADKSGNLYNSLTIMDKDNNLVSRPQNKLNEWLSSASLDPSEFINMKPLERVSFLQEALGLKEQFDQLQYRYNNIFTNRTKLGSDNTKMTGRLIPYEKLPNVGVDAEENQLNIDATMKELNEIDQLYERQANEAELSRKEDEQLDLANNIFDRRADARGDCQFRIKRLKEELEEEERKLVVLQKEEADAKKELEKAKANRSQGFTVPKEKIEEKAILKERLKNLYANTQQSEQIAVKHRLLKEKKEIEESILNCTQELDEIKEAKRELLRQAKFPVEGMAFGEDDLEMNGIPFNSSSTAEKILMAIVLNAAIDSKIKIIKIPDGSLLDDKSMIKLEEIADKNDLQVWIETVEREKYGNNILRIEEGHVYAH